MLMNAGIHEEVFLIDPDKRPEVDHAERSKLAMKEVKDSIESGKNFVYTATCGGTRIIQDLIRRMKAKKYHVVIAIVYASLPVALERIRKRSQSVPEDVVTDLHSFFKTKAERYMTMDADLYLYNNEHEFSLLLSKKKKHIVCRDSKADFYFDISKYC